MTKHILTVLFLYILIISCSEDPPVFPKNHNINMTIDAEVLETWIELHVDGLKKGATYIVQRDTTVVFEGKLDKADTLLHDENLEPNTSYNYSAYARQNGEKSETVTAIATTMDTTSHDFIITDYVIGTEDLSEFYDVIVVNDNLVIAVGEFFVDGQRYNMAKWNGEGWEFIELKVPYFGTSDLAVNFNGIAYLENIWFTGGADLFEWNDRLLKSLLMTAYLNSENYSKLWTFYALSDTAFFFGAGNGNLIYSDSRDYHLIPNKINLPVNDIYGIFDETSQKKRVFASLGNDNQLSDGFILEVTRKNSEQTLNWTTSIIPLSLWGKTLDKVFAITNKEFFIFTRQKIWQPDNSLKTNILLHQIRGNEINDIFVVGEFQYIAHYNGKTWKQLKLESGGKFSQCSVKGSTMAACGIWLGKAIVTIIQRK